MQSQRVRFEVFFAVGWLLFGTAVLPALIYMVGQVMLGTYAGGLGAFYSQLYADLFAGSGRAAAIVFGPYALMLLARLPFVGMKRDHEEPRDEVERPPEKRSHSVRVEPRFGPE